MLLLLPAAPGLLLQCFSFMVSVYHCQTVCRVCSISTVLVICTAPSVSSTLCNCPFVCVCAPTKQVQVFVQPVLCVAKADSEYVLDRK